MRNVVIVGVHRGLNEVEPLDIKQMCGRSGRVGFDPKGDAYILLPQSKFTRYKNWCENIPPIMSEMNKEDVLAFHIVSEISEGDVYDISSLMDWYNRSLAAFQSDFLDRIDAENLLYKLVKAKVVEKQGQIYKVTKLGTVASWLYYSPYTISAWYENFKQIFTQNFVDDISASWALSNINENKDNFVGRDLKNIVISFIKKCNEKNLQIPEGSATIGISYLACLTADEQLNHIKGKVKFDIERTVSALKMIDTMYAKWDKNKFWEQLSLRILYEVKEQHTELCSLKGVGGIKAKNLYAAGIKTIEDFKNKSELSSKVIGNNSYEKIIKENNL